MLVQMILLLLSSSITLCGTPSLGEQYSIEIEKYMQGVQDMRHYESFHFESRSFELPLPFVNFLNKLPETGFHPNSTEYKRYIECISTWTTSGCYDSTILPKSDATEWSNYQLIASSIMVYLLFPDFYTHEDALTASSLFLRILDRYSDEVLRVYSRIIDAIFSGFLRLEYIDDCVILMAIMKAKSHVDIYRFLIQIFYVYGNPMAASNYLNFSLTRIRVETSDEYYTDKSFGQICRSRYPLTQVSVTKIPEMLSAKRYNEVFRPMYENKCLICLESKASSFVEATIDLPFRLNGYFLSFYKIHLDLDQGTEDLYYQAKIFQKMVNYAISLWNRTGDIEIEKEFQYTSDEYLQFQYLKTLGIISISDPYRKKIGKESFLDASTIVERVVIPFFLPRVHNIFHLIVQFLCDHKLQHYVMEVITNGLSSNIETFFNQLMILMGSLNPRILYNILRRHKTPEGLIMTGSNLIDYTPKSKFVLNFYGKISRYVYKIYRYLRPHQFYLAASTRKTTFLQSVKTKCQMLYKEDDLCDKEFTKSLKDIETCIWPLYLNDFIIRKFNWNRPGLRIYGQMNHLELVNFAAKQMNFTENFDFTGIKHWDEIQILAIRVYTVIYSGVIKANLSAALNPIEILKFTTGYLKQNCTLVSSALELPEETSKLLIDYLMKCISPSKFNSFCRQVLLISVIINDEPHNVLITWLALALHKYYDRTIQFCRLNSIDVTALISFDFIYSVKDWDVSKSRADIALP